ncbi:hypothetical protein Pelo_10940 [Pelomyxa schiedti]|nr:hypothetical protein Pelo_10940 [Pelomyxa schiedti]
MKPLNNRMSHILHIASTCRHGCNSPESVKHILNTCRHNAAIRKELRLNSLKTLMNLVGLYNYHVSTLPQNLALLELRRNVGLPTQSKIDSEAVIPPNHIYPP